MGRRGEIRRETSPRLPISASPRLELSLVVQGRNEQLKTSAERCLVRAATIPAPGAAIELREYPVPVLEPGSALLRVEVAEVCGTDVHLQQGRLAETPYPLIPGHAAVGVLERISGAIHDVEGKPFREGERVTFLDVRGVWGIDFSHLHRALLILQRYNDRFRWDRLVTGRYRLDEAGDALRGVAAGEHIKAVIHP